MLSAIDLALGEKFALEQDLALEKTMKSVNSLRRVCHSWREANALVGAVLPPSFQWLIHDSESRLKEIAQLIGSDPGPVAVDPSGKTLSEILIAKLESAPLVSPLDNCLVRPRVLRPRIRRLNLDFFKRVQRYIKALQEY